ncbi:MAG TPA: redoxin domain-containing protein [Kofleriaceae bacterium]|nr:redoxin domain-containing protein [Kofleriaceae bacterium]
MSPRTSAALVVAALALAAAAGPARADEGPGAGGERPPWLGVGIEDGQRGVRITEVIDGTPADRAGLAIGDEIVRLDGRPLTAAGDLQTRLHGRESGDGVWLEIARGTRRLRVRAVLAPRLEEAEILERRLLDKPAPRFDLPLASGAGSGDLARMGGKVVVIEFLASWCGACKTTYRALSDLDERRRRDGLVVLGIGDDSEAALRALASAENLSFTLLRDVGGAARRSYRVTDLPTIVVIDRAGVVRYAGVGGGLPVDHAVFAAERALGDEK